MANEIKLPEETLMKLGFRFLDIIYGELTIKKGKNWSEVFIDKDDNARLGYDKSTADRKGSLLSYLYKDGEFFFDIFPVERNDFERVLRDWMLERYKREVVRVHTTRYAIGVWVLK